MGIKLLTESADDRGLVELIVLQELERFAVEGDVDLADGVVGGGLGVSLCDASLEPGVQQPEAITALDLK